MANVATPVLPPSKLKLLGVIVTPKPCDKVNVFDVVIPKSVVSEPTGDDVAESTTSYTNCPALPDTLSTFVSTSEPNTTLLGDKYFCVVDLWSKLAFGNK